MAGILAHSTGWREESTIDVCMSIILIYNLLDCIWENDAI
jgi:hypothetical protein